MKVRLSIGARLRANSAAGTFRVVECSPRGTLAALAVQEHLQVIAIPYACQVERPACRLWKIDADVLVGVMLVMRESPRILIPVESESLSRFVDIDHHLRIRRNARLEERFNSEWP